MFKKYQSDQYSHILTSQNQSSLNHCHILIDRILVINKITALYNKTSHKSKKYAKLFSQNYTCYSKKTAQSQLTNAQNESPSNSCPQHQDIKDKRDWPSSSNSKWKPSHHTTIPASPSEWDLRNTKGPGSNT